MLLPKYLKVGFRGKPSELQLQGMENAVAEVLKTVRVSSYNFTGECNGFFYYTLDLEAEESKMHPTLTVTTYWQEMKSRLRKDPYLQFLDYGKSVIVPLAV